MAENNIDTTQQTEQKSQTDKKFKNEIEVGAAWVKQSKAGKYLSLKLELDDKEYNLVGFKNRFKTDPNDNKPSYRFYFSKKSLAETAQKQEQKTDEVDI